jgi:2-polyprenyl-6-hydroxyphenyl methylase/3-demethylubiquinone-9 3-methyltransferase
MAAPPSRNNVGASRSRLSRYPRNDVRQYDDLAEQWHDPTGSLAMLHWIAAARAELVPPSPRPGAILVDIACGGGLFAPHARRLGYRHVGVDVNRPGLVASRQVGVLPVQGDARALPVASGCADVVVAGEVLEHVPDLPAVVRESCRVLRPGGTVVIDTIADTRLARLVAITVAERIPGGPPPGIHDPALFVNRRQLVDEYARYGVRLTLAGIRPPILSYLRWLAARSRASVPTPTFHPTRMTAVTFQAHGTKETASVVHD